ncbi:hypothetical protein PL81_37000 [Streptomyces sp. RSD-27]|nr:hypothetical protein PL81_37000 [Streptomyces sp. RSD-27]
MHLADDPSDEDRLSGWSTDDDADDADDALAALAAPGAGPLAVLGEVRVIDRYRSGSGGPGPMLAWPARVRGGAAAEGPAGGVVCHGVPYADPPEGCVCERQGSGGLVPVSWCAEHGNAAAPVMEWYPGDDPPSTALTAQRTPTAARP